MIEQRMHTIASTALDIAEIAVLILGFALIIKLYRYLSKHI